MELYIDRNALGRTLAGIQGIVERRSTTPVLSHTLLHARPDGLRINRRCLHVRMTEPALQHMWLYLRRDRVDAEGVPQALRIGLRPVDAGNSHDVFQVAPGGRPGH